MNENPSTIAVGQECGASMSEGDTWDCTAAGQISPVNTDVSKVISGWEYTNQTAFKNVGAQKVKVGVPAATHGYIYESVDPGETETIGAGASGHVILEYDAASGANDWCGVEVVTVQILED